VAILVVLWIHAVQKQKEAYTIVEMIIVMLFLAAFAAVAVPRINFSAVTKRKADALARKIMTDLRRTRTLAFSNAASNTEGFGLYMLGSSPYSGYEIRNIATSGVVDSHSITTGISCTGGATFKFGPFGDLLAGSDTSVTLSAEGKTFTITIIAATGMVKCIES
jgi:type II secretory pathway pseudopilin PulG